MTAQSYDVITPPREGAIRVHLVGDDPGMEVELGHQGIGVWLGILTRRGDRRLTLAVGEDGARKLSKTLIQAADASAKNRLAHLSEAPDGR